MTQQANASRWARRGPFIVVGGITSFLALATLCLVWGADDSARRALTGRIAELRRRGEPISVEECLAAPIPDERNAVRKLDALTDKLAFRRVMKLELPDVSSPTAADDFDELRTLLADFTDELDVLCEACEGAKWRLERHEVSSLRYYLLSDGTFALCARAMLEAIDGECARAAATISSALAVRRGIVAQPTMWDLIAWLRATDGVLRAIDLFERTCPQGAIGSEWRSELDPAQVRSELARAIVMQRALILESTGAVRDGEIRGTVGHDLDHHYELDTWGNRGPFARWGLIEYLDRIDTILELVRSSEPSALLDCPSMAEWHARTPWYAPLASSLMISLQDVFSGAHDVERKLAQRSW